MLHTYLKMVLVVSLLQGACCVWAQRVEVRKKATGSNPTLMLGQFDGDTRVAQRLKQTLLQCDWFSLVDGAPATYQVTGRHVRDVGSESLALRITNASGEGFDVREAASTGAVDTLVFAAVDAILKQVFAVPGLCSSKIAYAVGGQGAMKEIFVANFDGTGGTRLTHNSSISTEPSWGPGGRTLVYTVYENNATGVVMVDIPNRRQRRLSRFPGLNAGADLSPDARWAALSLSRDRRIELYLLSVAGGTLHRLTQDMAVESSPCWSPDGTRLCYVSDKGGNPQLYIMPARGGASTKLLSTWDETVSPDWSAVSNQVCFSTRLGGQYVIGVVDMADRSRQRRIVTKGAGDWEAPSWAPDGRHVICSRRTGASRSLYMVDTWYGTAVLICQGGDYSLPSWSDLSE